MKEEYVSETHPLNPEGFPVHFEAAERALQEANNIDDTTTDLALVHDALGTLESVRIALTGAKGVGDGAQEMLSRVEHEIDRLNEIKNKIH